MLTGMAASEDHQSIDDRVALRRVNHRVSPNKSDDLKLRSAFFNGIDPKRTSAAAHHAGDSLGRNLRLRGEFNLVKIA